MKVDDNVIPLIPSSGNNRLPGVYESYIKSYKKQIVNATALVIVCAFCMSMVYFFFYSPNRYACKQDQTNASGTQLY